MAGMSTPGPKRTSAPGALSMVPVNVTLADAGGEGAGAVADGCTTFPGRVARASAARAAPPQAEMAIEQSSQASIQRLVICSSLGRAADTGPMRFAPLGAGEEGKPLLAPPPSMAAGVRSNSKRPATRHRARPLNSLRVAQAGANRQN